MSEATTTETFTLTPALHPLANPETLAAQTVLRPAREAASGDLVGLSQDFYFATPTGVAQPRETKFWAMEGERFMPRRVAQINAPIRAQAALAHALLAEDQLVHGIALQAIRQMSGLEGETLLVALFVPGGTIVYQPRHDLSVLGREGQEAQDHLEATQRVFLYSGLSNHARVVALDCLSAAATDLARWGTIPRNFGPLKRNQPALCKVEVRL